MYPYNIAIHYHWHSPYLVIVRVCILSPNSGDLPDVCI